MNSRGLQGVNLQSFRPKSEYIQLHNLLVCKQENYNDNKSLQNLLQRSLLTSQLSSSDCVVPLTFIKFCRHRYYCFLYGHVQLSLGHLLHLQQQPGADELGGHRKGLISGDKELCTSIVVDHLEVK